MPIKPFWGVLLAALLAAIGIAAVFADRAAPAAESPDSPYLSTRRTPQVNTTS